MRLLLAALVSSCSAGPMAHRAVTPDSPVPAHFVLAGGSVVGIGLADVEILDGRIVSVGRVSAEAEAVDVAGRWIAPAFIDSHVHLAYWPVAEELADGGVAAAVDLASPIEFLSEDHAPLRVLEAGPMITAQGGYPLNAWGSDGYGLACDDSSSAVLAVDDVRGRGADLVKIPLAGEPELSDDALRAAIDRAHALGMKVAVHALGDDEARRAAEAGADVLAHCPVESLSDQTLALWEGRAVVSTLGAFGGTDAAVDNLRALRAGGATVLYGTDLGNSRDAGISLREIDLLIAAGMNGGSILAAATAGPAEFWGLDGLGTIEPGAAASLLVLADDPLLDPTTLANPVGVWVDGIRRD